LTTLADRLTLTQNRPAGFDWMRVILACGVVGFHTIVVSYGRVIERLYTTTPINRLPVAALLGMFFVLSGFLVASSLERCRTLVSFAGLRIMRIFPALVVEVMISAFHPRAYPHPCQSQRLFFGLGLSPLPDEHARHHPFLTAGHVS